MSGSYGGGGGVQFTGHMTIPDRDLIFARLRRTPTEVEANGVTIKCITEIKSKEKFVLFLIVRDEPVLLEDKSPLFPSDTLISQLQMLIG